MSSIRLAEVRDAAAIAHVHVQSWRTTYEGIVPGEYLASLNEAERVPLWQDWLARDIFIFVAENEGEVVGFAGGGAIREPHETYDAELYTLYLLQEAQGRGLGKALLGAVAQALVQQGYKAMLVWVLEQNPAVGFYERAGAHFLTTKQIEIGGVPLAESALGWPDLDEAITKWRSPIRPEELQRLHLVRPMAQNGGMAFATYPSLRDRVVLITGGGSGIGASAVEQFALQGARVAFLDLALEASLALVAELTPRVEHPPLFVPCDLTEMPALQNAIADVAARLGSPAVLINNAGNDDRHPFADVTPAFFDDRIAVNLRHYFFAAQAVAPAMATAGAGVILNLSSISWMIPGRDLTVYNMAKAAIVSLTRSLAHELGAANIRVNAVLPGAILTERQRRLWYTPEYEAEVLGSQCLKRNLLPEEVARLLLFLAADDSAAITNQNYIIDGGWI